MIEIAAVGSGSTGKSALLNALFGTSFELKAAARITESKLRATVSFHGKQVAVFDSPPLGEQHAVASTSDVVLFICDKDLTSFEFAEIRRVAALSRPLAVVLNKSDTFAPAELGRLLRHIRFRLHEIVPPERNVTCAAHPVRMVLHHPNDGTVREHVQHIPPEVASVRAILQELIAEAEQSPRAIARDMTEAAIRHGAKAIKRTRDKLAQTWRR